jgi:hypothetical protein
MSFMNPGCYPVSFHGEARMTWTQTLVLAGALLIAGIGIGHAQSDPADDYKIAPISGQGSLVWIIASDGRLWFCGARGDLQISCEDPHQLQ